MAGGRSVVLIETLAELLAHLARADPGTVLEIPDAPGRWPGRKARNARLRLASVPATPALDRLLSRGRRTDVSCTVPDDFRCALFGIECPPGAAPAGALTRLSDRPEQDNEPLEGCFLRADPVWLRADVARVYLAGTGTQGLEQDAWRSLAECAAEVFAAEGMQLHADHPDRWTLRPGSAPAVAFPALASALGADVSEVLPAGEGARFWRRLHNEIQMSLFAHPLNQQRRERGLPLVNGVWFWGYGSAPRAAPGGADWLVCTDHPVTRGLARLAGAPLYPEAEAERIAGQACAKVLFDLGASGPTPAAALEHIERLLAALVRGVRQDGLTIELHADGPADWQLGRPELRRWWRRIRPAAEVLRQETGYGGAA